MFLKIYFFSIESWIEGVLQGAPISSMLFVHFMNTIISYLKSFCFGKFQISTNWQTCPTIYAVVCACMYALDSAWLRVTHHYAISFPMFYINRCYEAIFSSSLRSFLPLRHTSQKLYFNWLLGYQLYNCSHLRT